MAPTGTPQAAAASSAVRAVAASSTMRSASPCAARAARTRCTEALVSRALIAARQAGIGMAWPNFGTS